MAIVPSNEEISMENTYNYWTTYESTSASSYSLISNGYSSNSSIQMTGTIVLYLNLTKYNLEYSLNSNSMIRFSWRFTSNSYDYIGIKILTNTEHYYFVSHFGKNQFYNNSNYGFREFTNEQPNTWYEHDVNLSALYLQNYGTIPTKIQGILLSNYYYTSTLVSSNQLSNFDNIVFYSGNNTPSLIVNSSLNSLKTTNSGNTPFQIMIGILLVGGVGIIGAVVYSRAKRQNKNLGVHNEQSEVLKDNQFNNQTQYQYQKQEYNKLNNFNLSLCPNCKEEALPEDVFCHNCGSRIK